MVAGYNWRTDRQWEQMAWVVSHLLNISGKSLKHRVTPKKLLHRPATIQDQEAWWKREEEKRRRRQQSKEGG